MRNEYDALKVLAIILVVLGHISILYGGGSFGYLPANRFLQGLTSVIYLFHMPLFVSLSGAIYNIGCERGKYGQFLPFLKTKVLRLLVPFVMVGVFFLAPSLVLLRLTELPLLDCIGNILVGGGMEKHLWYLPALFWIFLFAWLMQKCRVSVVLWFILSVVLAVVCSLFFSFSFLFLSNAIQYLPYFALGMMLNKYRAISNKSILIVGIVFFTVVAIITKATDIALLDNFCRVLLPCGIVASLVAVARMVILPKDNCILSFILNQSFPIYLFHVMVIYAMYKLVGLNVPTLIMVPSTFVVAISMSIFIAWLCRKLHFQFILGEKRS